MSVAIKQDAGRGTRRAEQARATRHRIIDQAARLFAEQGYAATTLEQIAAAADVAVQTVYFHFRNKATVLRRSSTCWQPAMTGRYRYWTGPGRGACARNRTEPGR
jgi:AcrR family transcriptional regulator